VRRIVALMIPVMIGSSVAQISLLLDSALASFLGDGAVSWLYFADRLMEFPLGIFSIAIGTVILPTLAAQHATKSAEQFSATLDWGLRTMLVIGVPAALGLVLLAGPLIATLFAHGRFTAEDVAMTTVALWAYAGGFLGFSLVKVLVPGFYARQEVRIPVRYGIIALVSGMAISLVVFALGRHFQWQAAHAGLAAATSASAWINSLLLLRRLRADGIYRPGLGWPAFLARLAAGNLAMAAIVLWLNQPTAAWLAMDLGLRARELLVLVAAAMLVYFATLGLAGLRPRHFRRA
jgi:putative peptidoglycan lipid II flippase